LTITPTVPARLIPHNVDKAGIPAPMNVRQLLITECQDLSETRLKPGGETAQE